MTTPPLLNAEGLTKAYASAATPVLGGVSFVQSEGEFLSVVGPSGCGKTTLLRCLAGLMLPDEGAVSHSGQQFSGPPDWMSIVFQDYNRSLFPWLTVRGNVGFGLREREKGQKAHMVDEIIEAVGLSHAADLYPWQISGGMQQRCALARSLVSSPRLLLLDEPFASVDAQTRIDLQDLMMRLVADRGISALLVTHDIEEAVFMGDRVVVLSTRPARVVEEVNIDIPKPRDQLSTKESPRFLEFRHHVYTSVRRQAGAAV
ncbi:ABC transporter ATP-binding protein [Roseovarius sp. S4756]|uniref:ABC transporter ATP-binding protein n=1 Tax=Roseovarius maritimus TaxID=3342637 RepID=UPI00372BF304